MNICYLCGKEFNSSDVQKHDEHIIQQAIGGNLTANDILCSSCGGKLGNQIDVPFNNIFNSISSRMDIKKDRKNNDKPLHGKMGHINVVWKDFKVSPLKPFHVYTIDKKQVIIYTNPTTAKKYKHKVEQEIQKDFTNEQPNIFICDDLEGVVEFPFNMDIQAFNKGLAKISIGFASSHGINRENLSLVLDINNDTNEAVIQNKIFTIPFFPLGIIDILFETQKNEFEHYPSHNLILFTINCNSKIEKNKKVLICYIELFSTFQYYIVLNEAYYGDSIYKYYSQQILKKDDYIVEVGRRYYKERNIWLQPLGITEEYIDKKHTNQKYKILSKLEWYKKLDIALIAQQPNLFQNLKNRFQIEQEIIQEETIKQKYKLDFEDYINNNIKAISNQFLVFLNKKNYPSTNDLPPFLKNENMLQIYNNLFNNIEDYQNFKKNLDLFYQFDTEENEKFSIFSFRVFYFENNKLKNYYSTLLEQFSLLLKDGRLKTYHHKKMYMLENYIQQEILRRKNLAR